jgi:hypothetical protein
MTPGTYRCELSRSWLQVKFDNTMVFRHELRVLHGPEEGRRIITETAAMDVPEELEVPDTDSSG